MLWLGLYMVPVVVVCTAIVGAVVVTGLENARRL